MVIAVFLLLAGVVVAWFVFYVNDPERRASTACHDHVEDRLKSPATAEFSDERAVDHADGSFTAYGTVDSENGFGALVRNDYMCEVVKRGDLFLVESAKFSGDD